MAFDLLTPLLALVALVLLVRHRRWPLWRAYALCAGLYLAYGYSSTYPLIGGPGFSDSVLMRITSAIDTLIQWNAQGRGQYVQYHGHTEREFAFMLAVYPVITVLIVPTLIFWVIAVQRRRRASAQAP